MDNSNALRNKLQPLILLKILTVDFEDFDWSKCMLHSDSNRSKPGPTWFSASWQRFHQPTFRWPLLHKLSLIVNRQGDRLRYRPFACVVMDPGD